jgi:hypothetical protein
MTGMGSEFSISVVGLPSGYVVKSMTAGSTDLLAQPLKIPPGATAVPEIVIILAVDSLQREN